MMKTDILKMIDDSWAEWEHALSRVSPDRMSQPGAVGEWTVKDVVAHVSWAVIETVGMIEARALVGSELWQIPQDERNAVVYRQNLNRPLDELLAESREAQANLVELVRAVPEPELLQADWFAAIPGDWPPWRVIQANVTDHYTHHAQDIARWLESTPGTM